MKCIAGSHNGCARARGSFTETGESASPSRKESRAKISPPFRASILKKSPYLIFTKLLSEAV